MGTYNISYTSPTGNGITTREYPFSNIGNTASIISVPYAVNTANYSPATLNGVISSSFYCVGDVAINNDPTGLTTYVRQYANVPSQIVEYRTYAATFPGIFNGRRPFSRAVPMKVVKDFYLVGSGGAYSSEADIPIVSAQSYSYSTDSSNHDPSEFFLNTGGLDPSTPSVSGYYLLGSYGLVVQDSIISRYKGNIWMRESYKVSPI